MGDGNIFMLQRREMDQRQKKIVLKNRPNEKLVFVTDRALLHTHFFFRFANNIVIADD